MGTCQGSIGGMRYVIPGEGTEDRFVEKIRLSINNRRRSCEKDQSEKLGMNMCKVAARKKAYIFTKDVTKIICAYEFDNEFLKENPPTFHKKIYDW